MVIHSDVWSAVEATIADLQRQVNAVQRDCHRNTRQIQRMTPPRGVPIPPDMPTIFESRALPLFRAYAPGELRGRETSGGMPRYPLEGEESANTTESGE